MGLDIINPIQVTAEAMSPESLQKEYGKDIVFFGGIDVQHVLTKGNPASIADEVKRVSNILGKDGLYILAPAHDYLLPEIPSENIIAMYRCGLNNLGGCSL